MTESAGAEVTPGEIADVLRSELATSLEIEPGEIDLTTRITELPGIDSMKVVNVVVACERRWNVSIDEEDLFYVRTGEDLADLVVRTVNARRSPT